MGNNGLLGRVASAIGVAITILLFGLWAGFHTGLLASAVKGYDCENMKPELLALSEKRAPQNNGVSMIGIVEAKAVTATPKFVECSGKAKWSDTTESAISYKAYLQEDQWWLEYRPG